MNRRAMVFGAVLAAAGLLSFVVPAPPVIYWPVALGAALLLSLGSRRVPAGSLWTAGGGEFLCDRCKYNDPRYCSRPERPNATRCPDYKDRM